MPRFKNIKSVKTADGHTASIIRVTNALAFFWHSYRVDIHSGSMHDGNKRDLIYSFKTGAVLDNAVRAARAWKASDIFRLNPYLLKAAEEYATSTNP